MQRKEKGERSDKKDDAKKSEDGKRRDCEERSGMVELYYDCRRADKTGSKASKTVPRGTPRRPWQRTGRS